MIDMAWPTTHGESPGIVIGEQPDHRLIVLTSDRHGNYFGRLHRDGSADRTYRAAVPPDFAGYQSGWLEAAVDAAGRLVVAYADDNKGDYPPDIAALVRYDAKGRRDRSYGEVRLAPPGRSDGRNVYVQSLSVNAAGDAVLYTNTKITNETWQAHMVRITAAGAVDPRWGDGGYVTIKPLNMIVSRTWHLDDGTTWAMLGGTTGPALLALDARGRSRRDLGTDGRIRFPTAFRPQFTSVLHVDQQSHIYVALGQRSPKLSPGGALPGGIPARSIARLLPNGQIDTRFGENGFARLDGPLDHVGPTAIGLVEDQEGRLVVTTSTGLVRLLPDGSFDPAFDFDGRSDTFAGSGAPVLANEDGVYLPNSGSTGRMVELPDFTLLPDMEEADKQMLLIAAQQAGTRISVRDLPNGAIRVELGATTRTFTDIARIKLFGSDSDDRIGYRSVLPVDVAAKGGDDAIDVSNSRILTVDTGDGDDEVVSHGSLMVMNSLGDDTIVGGGGNLNVYAMGRATRPDGTVADTATADVRGDFGSGKRVVLRLGEGSDFVRVSAGTISLQDTGGNNHFRLQASRGASVSVQGGRSIIDTFDGDDTIRTGAGRDTIRTRGGNDYIGKITDRYGRTLYDPRSDTILSGDGDDTLFGSYGDDWLEGGAGRDVFMPLHGADTLYGGPQRDTANLIDEIDLDEDDNHIESVEDIRYAM